MADHLHIGILLQQAGRIDLFVINGRENDVFSTAADGFPKLFYLLIGAFRRFRSRIISGIEAIHTHYGLEVGHIRSPAVYDGIVRKQHGYLCILGGVVVILDTRYCQYG